MNERVPVLKFEDFFPHFLLTFILFFLFLSFFFLGGGEEEFFFFLINQSITLLLRLNLWAKHGSHSSGLLYEISFVTL